MCKTEIKHPGVPFSNASLISFRARGASAQNQACAVQTNGTVFLYGRVRKWHPRMFYRCLTHGALIGGKDRIPLKWCFRTQPKVHGLVHGPYQILKINVRISVIKEINIRCLMGLTQWITTFNNT